MTKPLAVWRGVVQEIASRPGMTCIEKPLNECTTQELEQWALERLRIQMIYNYSLEIIPARPRCVEYSIPSESIEGIILPGGKRFIVVTRSRGAVHQYDLDSPGSQFHELIPAKQYNDEPGNGNICHAIWIDDSQPRLTFRLALCCRFWRAREYVMV